MTDKQQMPEVVFVAKAKYGLKAAETAGGYKRIYKYLPFINQSAIKVPDGLENSIEILQQHQDWRRGADIPLQDVKKLGVAIDAVLEAARELQRIKELG